MRMREETRKQNEILDEIHAGLGQIHSNAKVRRHVAGTASLCEDTQHTTQYPKSSCKHTRTVAHNGPGAPSQTLARMHACALFVWHMHVYTPLWQQLWSYPVVLSCVYVCVSSCVQAIGSKIEQSTKDFEGVGERIQDTRSRIKNANKKSILADFKAKD